MHYFSFVATFSVFTYQKEVHAEDLRNDLRIPLLMAILSIKTCTDWPLFIPTTYGYKQTVF